MPPRRNSAPESPPPVMTWRRATPVLVVAGIFDAIQIFFTFFWLTGPALAALYCTVKTTDTLAAWTFGLLGAKTAATVCSATAAVAGAAAIEITVVVGVVMSMAIGIIGWLTVIVWMLVSNSRIFKENAGNILWLIIGFMMDEAPLLSALPALSVTTWKMHHEQIKKDKERRAAYIQRQRAQEAAEQSQQVAQIMQARAMQEAENDALYEQAQAANDEQYQEDIIPEEEKKAA